MNDFDNNSTTKLLKKIEREDKRRKQIRSLIFEKNQELLEQGQQTNSICLLFCDYYQNKSLKIKKIALDFLITEYKTNKNIQAEDFKNILIWHFKNITKQENKEGATNDSIHVITFFLFDRKKKNSFLSNHIEVIYDSIWFEINQETQFNILRCLAESFIENNNINVDWFFNKLKNYYSNCSVEQKNTLIDEIFTNHTFCQIINKKQAWFFLENYKGQIKTDKKHNILQNYILFKWFGRFDILDKGEEKKPTYILNEEEELFLFKKFDIEYNIKNSLNKMDKNERRSPFDNLILSMLYHDVKEKDFFSSTWRYALTYHYKEIEKFGFYNDSGDKSNNGFFAHLSTVSNIDTLNLLVKYNITPEKVGEKTEDIISNSYGMRNDIKSVFENVIAERKIIQNDKKLKENMGEDFKKTRKRLL